jgi:hypothetical protein
MKSSAGGKYSTIAGGGGRRWVIHWTGSDPLDPNGAVCKLESGGSDLAMNEHLVEAYHALKWLVPAGAIWTTLRWFHGRWQKYQNDQVLSTFHNKDGPWQSANGVVGELYLKASLSDAPGFFPPRRMTMRHRFRVMYFRTRHFARRVFLIPNKKKADKLLHDLCFERKILERAGWDHTDNEFYKLKKSVG